MASPPPQTLHKRVITAYENGEGRSRELAERYRSVWPPGR